MSHEGFIIPPRVSSWNDNDSRCYFNALYSEANQWNRGSIVQLKSRGTFILPCVRRHGLCVSVGGWKLHRCKAGKRIYYTSRRYRCVKINVETFGPDQNSTGLHCNVSRVAWNLSKCLSFHSVARSRRHEFFKQYLKILFPVADIRPNRTNEGKAGAFYAQLDKAYIIRKIDVRVRDTNQLLATSFSSFSGTLKIRRIFVLLRGHVEWRKRIMFTRVRSPIVYKTPGGASSGKYFLGERCLHATIGFVVPQGYPRFLYPTTWLVYTCNSTDIQAGWKIGGNAVYHWRRCISSLTACNR